MIEYEPIDEFKVKYKHNLSNKWFYCKVREPHIVKCESIPDWITVIAHRQISIEHQAKSEWWQLSDQKSGFIISGIRKNRDDAVKHAIQLMENKTLDEYNRRVTLFNSTFKKANKRKTRDDNEANR